MEELIYVDRRGTNSYKWDYSMKTYGSDVIAMTAADWDFKCPACVRRAMKDYIDMGALGYTSTPEEWYQAFMDWEKERHQNEIRKEWLRYAPGVVSALAWILGECFHPGDACIILTPVYGPIIHTPERCGLRLVRSELVNEKGVYSIDFRDFEEKIVQNHVKLFLLCSPHNPVGRVWTREELEKLVDICRKNEVFIVSDEIHHDITFAGHRHILILQVGDYQDHMAMLTSPAKTFNLATSAENIRKAANSIVEYFTADRKS